MAIKGAARARIQYSFKKCVECGTMDNEKTMNNGVCLECRADKYNVAPNMVMEYEDKLSAQETIVEEAPVVEEPSTEAITYIENELDEIAAEAREIEADRKAYSTYPKADLLESCRMHGMNAKSTAKKQELLNALMGWLDAETEKLDRRAEALMNKRQALRQSTQPVVEDAAPVVEQSDMEKAHAYVAQKQVQRRARKEAEAHKHEAERQERLAKMQEAGLSWEIISTPKTPKPFTIKEEAHPFRKDITFFRAYYQDGTPVYIGSTELAETERRLRSFEMVSEITVEYLNPPTPEQPTTAQETPRNDELFHELYYAPVEEVQAPTSRSSQVDYCSVCQCERTLTILEDVLECTACTSHIWKEPAPDDMAWQKYQEERTAYYARATVQMVQEPSQEVSKPEAYTLTPDGRLATIVGHTVECVPIDDEQPYALAIAKYNVQRALLELYRTYEEISEAGRQTSKELDTEAVVEFHKTYERPHLFYSTHHDTAYCWHTGNSFFYYCYAHKPNKPASTVRQLSVRDLAPQTECITCGKPLHI